MLTNEIDFSKDATEIEIKMVELSKDQNFNLLLVVENMPGNKKTLKFLSILYKDLFYTKTYAEARHYIESFKIFADQKYADLDTNDFEIREKKDEKGRINHSFFCKFIKEENVYLSRATAKTIASMFLESTFSYPKQNLFENSLMAFPIHFTRYDIPEDIKKLLDNNVEKLEKAHLSQELKTYISSTLRNLYL
jgi:hypothetical protein